MSSDTVPTDTTPVTAASVTLLRALAETLDSLRVAVCVFDDDMAALLWNRRFLEFFPEHAAHIHVGEAYALNLRRFYQGRLGAQEMPEIERYIQEGVARHREQRRPYRFDHHGLQLEAAALVLPGIGSMRVWRHDDPGTGKPVSPGTFGDMALFEHVADGVMLTGADDRIVWVNQPAVAMYGLHSPSAAVGLTLEQVYRIAWEGAAAEHRAAFDDGLAVFGEHLRFSDAPFEAPLPDDRWARVMGQRSPEGRGFFMHVDITVLKRQQHQLREAERRARKSEALLQQKSTLLEATLDHMAQGLMMVNADRVVEICNRRAIELLGLPPALMASRPNFSEVLAFQWASEEFAGTPPDVLDFVRAGGILDQPHCYDRRRPDGRVVEIRSMPIAGGGIVRTYEDITERRQAEERIHHLARHDGLTGLANRAVFLEALAAAVARRPVRAFAVHFVDVDKFKPINDRLGHAVGDQVLALLAARMCQIAGDEDIVARMGGDEFAVLQHDADAPQALAFAQRLLAAIRLPMQVERHPLQLGASIGVALHPASGDEADLLLRRADAAMYLAKAEGSDRVRLDGGAPQAADG